MAWKNLNQRSLADSMMIDHEAIKELDGIHEFIDWDRIEGLLQGIHASPRGEKAWSPLLMIKALLLQSWYKLSDPALEKQLARDLLFRRFVALDISESVPDHSALWRFRQTLQRLSLMDKLLTEINRQLTEQGVLVQSGSISIVDASVIEAKQCRPNRGKNGQSSQDQEAAWSVKTGSEGKRQSTYGYKAHINVDEDGLIKATDYTPGNVHDSNCFTDLLDGDEAAVYADSAYCSDVHHAWLKQTNIVNRITKRVYRSRPLGYQDKQFNKLHAGLRSTLERVFGVLKLHYGMAKVRYMGLDRNRTGFELMCVAHNIKRALSIRQASCA